MGLERKWPLITIVSLGIGLGTVLIAGRSVTRRIFRWRFSKQNGLLLTKLKEKLENPMVETTVVTHISEWEAVYPKLSKDCKEIPILGFDCEWVSAMKSSNRSQQPVALIQLASHQGVCALIRICCFPTIPETLKGILSNPNILKVGVATGEDASKLKRDLGIHLCGGYDVRHLIHRHPNAESLSTKSGLAGLSEQLIGTKLSKHFSVRCSDWEAEDLSESQVKYAAQDALASIAVCLKLIAETTKDLHLWSFQSINEFYSIWAKTCVAKDTKFRMPPNRLTSSFNGKEKKITPIKPNNSRAYAARKTALYDNCILQAPDGQQLCTCDYKKAMWYFAKGRGEVVCESPMTVRLNFEPSGRPSSEYDQYYLMDKVNKCVVCGQAESFLRKNIVPHEYRKHFPEHLKDHKSHDILLLCLECHTVCNSHENSIKTDLSIKCDAPIGTERDVKTKLDKRLSGVQRAANALFLNRDTIPTSRVTELEESIKQYYEVEVVTPEILAMARNLEIHVPNADYVPHGLKVVRYFEEQPGGLLALERLWREHFLKTMQPRHLPALWSVEHYRKPEEKWGHKLEEDS